LEELFKRIALSQFAIAFSLIHDGKKIKHLPASQTELAKAKRLATLCGNRMVEQSIYIDAEQNGLHLWGWLGMPAGASRHSDKQFFYINNRMVKDRLINHAIKQVYQDYCDPGKYPIYCLYFSLDVKTLDVNVHPTKHEVRFRDARVVHAFLHKVISEALAKQHGQNLGIQDNIELPMFPKKPIEEDDNNNAPVIQYTPNHCLYHDNNRNKNIKILCVIGNNKLILAEDENEHVVLVDVRASKEKLLINAFEQHFVTGTKVPSQPLLLPEAINFSKDINNIMQCANLFAVFGLQVEELGQMDLLIREVPVPLYKLNPDYRLILENLAKLFKEIIASRRRTDGSIAMPEEVYIQAPCLCKNGSDFSFTDLELVKCINLLVSYVHYPEQLSDKEAEQLIVDIKNLAQQSNRREKLTFKNCSLSELQDFVYKY
jgi:DNA mismatch repair protein MutL